MTSRWPRPLFYFALMFSIALDQATKAWATTSLEPIGSLTIIPDLFNLTYVGNTGVAFGMLAGHSFSRAGSTGHHGSRTWSAAVFAAVRWAT